MAKQKKQDFSASYDRFKEYKGKRYTGMKIGRSHHWHYDRGDWVEKKVTPDQWEFTYSTVKRRAGHAPEGSGAPVGTGYHWIMFAHQFVEKLNANDYRTHMLGLKFKLAHKRAGKEDWNAPGATRRKNLIALLRQLITELEKEPEQLVPVPLDFTYRKEHFHGNAVPIPATCQEGVCMSLDVTLNDEHLGIMRHTGEEWEMGGKTRKGLVKAIGGHVEEWYAQAA